MKDSIGFTPLHLAVFLRNVEGVRCLLQYGADPFVKDKDVWTFFFFSFFFFFFFFKKIKFFFFFFKKKGDIPSEIAVIAMVRSLIFLRVDDFRSKVILIDLLRSGWFFFFSFLLFFQ